MKVRIIGGYFCKELQHWVKIISPTKDNHKSFVHLRTRHRMVGVERKTVYDPTIEYKLRREMLEFLARKEDKLEKAKERS